MIGDQRRGGVAGKLAIEHSEAGRARTRHTGNLATPKIVEELHDATKLRNEDSGYRIEIVAALAPVIEFAVILAVPSGENVARSERNHRIDEDSSASLGSTGDGAPSRMLAATPA